MALKIFLVLFLCLNVSALYAAEMPWQLRENAEGITVFTRHVSGSPILEFKADAIIPVPMGKAVHFFEDADKISQWYYQCTHSEKIKDLDPQNQIIYIVLHLPPLADRDCIFKRIKSEDAANKTVSFSIEALPNMMPKVKGKIRVPYIKSVWEFTSLPNGQTKIHFQQFSNPGGYIPTFLINQLIIDIPFNSLKNFKRLLTVKNPSP